MAADGTFEHYLNGVLIDEPIGWRDFKEIIERDEDRRFIGVKYEGQVTFKSGGYDVLRELKAQNFCGIIPYRVFQQCGDDYQDAFAANILLTEVEWNLSRCTAAAVAADASYGTYVVNNGEIKLRPTAAQSKTGTDIAPCPYTPVYVFDPNDAAQDYLNVTGIPGNPGGPIMWDWKEAMDHCLQYISDGNISGITSDWYDSLEGTYINTFETNKSFAVTTGALLRSPQNFGSYDQFSPSQAPEYSFNDLWQNLAKKYDLWSAMELSYDGTYRLRVEHREYFFGSQVVEDTNIQDMTEGVDQTALYGRIKVGSEEFVRGVATDASIPYLLLMGFTNEEYHVPIQCNTEAALDLMSDFVIDSNVIERVVVGGSEEYEENVFLIEYIRAPVQLSGALLGYPAVKGDYIIELANPFGYNPSIINEEVIRRYTTLGAVQYITNDTDGFRAYEPAIGPSSSTTSGFGFGYFPVVPEQMRYRFDYITAQTPFGRDPGNNYGNGTPQGTPVAQVDSRYTAPVQGLYKMEIRMAWQILANFANVPNTAGKRIACRVIVERYDSGNVLIDQPLDYTGPQLSAYVVGPPYAQQFFTTPVFNAYMNATDYCVVKYQFRFDEAPFFPSGAYPIWTMQARPSVYGPGDGTAIYSYWKTEYIEGLGGEVLPPDLSGARTVLWKYDRTSTLAEWNALKAEPSAGVAVSPSDIATQLGHIRKVARVINSGETSWELIAPTTSSFIK